MPDGNLGFSDMVSDILSEREQRRKNKTAAVQTAMANALAEKRFRSDQEYRSFLMGKADKPEIKEVNGSLYRVWPNDPNKKPELVVQAPEKSQSFQQANQGEDLYTFNPSTGNFELKVRGKGKPGKVTAKYITPEGIELSGDYESLKPYVTGPSAQKPGDLSFAQEQRKKVVDLNNQISKKDPENLGKQISPEQVGKQIQYIVGGDSSSAGGMSTDPEIAKADAALARGDITQAVHDDFVAKRKASLAGTNVR